MARFVGDKSLKILEYIKTRPTASNAEIARECGMAQPTVRNKLAQLRKAGYCVKTKQGHLVNEIVETLPESSFPSTPQPPELDEIAEVMKLDGPERRKRMARLALTGSDNVQMAALVKLEEWDRQSGGSVGPRPPRTPEERIFRLSRLMVAVGKEEAALAWKAAEAEWEREATYRIVITGGADESKEDSTNREGGTSQALPNNVE